MVLVKMKQTAEAFLKQTVTDAVITVPAHFNGRQRKVSCLTLFYFVFIYISVLDDKNSCYKRWLERAALHQWTECYGASVRFG